MIRTRSVLLASLLVTTACRSTMGGDPPGPDPQHEAAVARWAPARLPFTARTEGLLVDRGIEMDPTYAGGRRELATPLLLLVPISPTRVAVVFPPSDREGLDLAWGGLDQPWERVSISDFPLSSIATVDGVAAADGTVHLVVRQRGGREVHHVRWRAGEDPTTDVVPTPAPIDGSGTDGFEDAVVEIAPDGSVDVLYRHWSPYQFVIARLDPGASAFRILSSVPGAENNPQALIGGVGARLLLSYDDTGTPIVAGLYDGARFRRPIPYSLGGDGLWRELGPSFPGRDEPDRLAYTGQFDLQRHPIGFVLGGPIRREENGGLEPFSARERHSEGYYSAEVRRLSESEGDVARQPCVGYMAQWRGYQGSEVEVRTQGFVARPSRCASPTRFVPVVARPDDLLREVQDELLDVVFASQDDWYTGTLCVLDDGTLVICEGAWESHDTSSPITPHPTIVSADPPSGSTIPESADVVITGTLENVAPGVIDEDAPTVHFEGTGAEIAHSSSVDVAAGTFRITIPGAGLIGAGSVVRIAFGATEVDGRARGLYLHPEVPPPVIHYVIGGEPFVGEDPRIAPIARDCVRAGGTGTACDPLEISATDATFRLRFVDHVQFPFGATFTLEGVDGSSVPVSPMAPPFGEHGLAELDVSIDGALAPGTDYELDLSRFVSMRWGAPIAEIDRVVRVRTLP